MLAEKNLKGGPQLQRAMVVFGCGPIVGKHLRLFDQVVAILEAGVGNPASAKNRGSCLSLMRAFFQERPKPSQSGTYHPYVARGAWYRGAPYAAAAVGGAALGAAAVGASAANAYPYCGYPPYPPCY